MRFRDHMNCRNDLSTGQIPIFCYVVLFFASSVCAVSRSSSRQALSANFSSSELNILFIDSILKFYGEDQNGLNLTELQLLLNNLSKRSTKTSEKAIHSESDVERNDGLSNTTISDIKSIAECLGNSSRLLLGDMSVQSCLLKKCLTAADVYILYKLPLSARITSDQLLAVTPALVYQAQRLICAKSTAIIAHKPPNPTEVWGFGFLCVTLINLCSLLGVSVMPFMGKRQYHVLLMFLIALAVGSLCGSSLLFLIPDSLGLNEMEGIKDVFVWKAMMVVAGIYLFFLIERFLKFILTSKEESALNKDGPRVSVMNVHILEQDPHARATSSIHSTLTRGQMLTMSSAVSRDGISSTNDEALLMQLPQDEVIVRNGTLNHKQEMNVYGELSSQATFVGTRPTVAPIAWMIIFGDGFHNLIDGLAIGAAFSDSVLAGVSISVAVFLEEFPHELGDFAILLKAGMTMKKALLYNFLSSCCCYFGLIIGIALGELTAASQWIFALAGGMFLYISLVDMMPEINQALEQDDAMHVSKTQGFFVQNLGLVCGFGSMLLMAIYGGQIDFTKDT